MTRRLVNESSHRRSVDQLDSYYRAGLIAPEKKAFLTDPRGSAGPYLGVEGGELICDAASQIATLGLGFNAGALFGVAQYLESWTNDTRAENVGKVRKAYIELLQRKLGAASFAARFCASGTEAIEATLAYFYDHRRDRLAKRVLAFEGSFHGRMMVALASTWNAAKREPFAWPGFEARFAAYPEMDHAAVSEPLRPDGWAQFWASAATADFKSWLAAVGWSSDATEGGLLAREVASLSAIRDHLTHGETFAILIEPMQCEGGDRYSSARFHEGLANLATAFAVPLIYDEIQTGFGLSGEFFWHRLFDLRLADGDPYVPDGVVCGKKAQLGISLTRGPEQTPVNSTAVPSTASLVRGYIQASVLDQFQSAIDKIEQLNRRHAEVVLPQFSPAVRRPRIKGLSLAFDFENADLVKQFVGQRFDHGLLFYPAGERTVRFRMNLAYREAELAVFWSQVESALGEILDGSAPASAAVEVEVPRPDAYYAFHESLIAAKLSRPGTADRRSIADEEAVLGFVDEQLAATCPESDLQPILLDTANYRVYRERILQLQAQIYEPARQSNAAEFDAVFADENPLAILVLERDAIVAMAFAGPLSRFNHLRGVPDDPYVNDPAVAYMLDLTVVEKYRGRLGRVVKQALTKLALCRGVTAIHGRNRDRLAGGMWAINLSLGSYPTQYLVDDYPDNETYRDCIYYRCPTQWSEPPIDLSSGITAPLGIEHVNMDFVRDNLPTLVNKLTLSNFVDEAYLRRLLDVAAIYPPELRHLYTASGLSECVDKLVKVLWRHRQPRTRLVTFAGHDFGQGSFLARSLSGIGDAYFDVVHLALPTEPGDTTALSELADQLADNDVLGVFVEPLMRRTMQPVALSVLRQIVGTCRSRDVPIVFNDTAGMFYRYSQQSFTAAGISEIQPDASVAYLGGQMAVAAATGRWFIDEPLLLISTWDGDAFSLAQFQRAMQAVESDVPQYQQTVAEFQQRLLSAVRSPDLADRAEVDLQISQAAGIIQGELSPPIAWMLESNGDGAWICCPSYSEMLRFNRYAAGSG